MLDRLPPSLQQMLMLEWLSPETVWTLVRASGVLRRCVLSSLQAFRAADKEILSDACVRWFWERGLRLVLFKERIERELWLFDVVSVVRYYSNGKRHRDADLPAAVFTDGTLETQEWWKNGRMHRDGDLPAVVHADGTQCWYQHGELHRDGDLPAIVYPSGTQEWYQHGERHRDGDLPAVVRSDGTQCWYDRGVPVSRAWIQLRRLWNSFF